MSCAYTLIERQPSSKTGILSYPDRLRILLRFLFHNFIAYFFFWMIQARCWRRLRYQFKAERGWRRGSPQQIGHTPLPITPRHRSESHSVWKLQHHRTPGSYLQIIKNISQRLRTTAALTRKKPLSNTFNTRRNNRNTYHNSPYKQQYVLKELRLTREYAV